MADHITRRQALLAAPALLAGNPAPPDRPPPPGIREFEGRTIRRIDFTGDDDQVDILLDDGRTLQFGAVTPIGKEVPRLWAGYLDPAADSRERRQRRGIR